MSDENIHVGTGLITLVTVKADAPTPHAARSFQLGQLWPTPGSAQEATWVVDSLNRVPGGIEVAASRKSGQSLRTTLLRLPWLQDIRLE